MNLVKLLKGKQHHIKLPSKSGGSALSHFERFSSFKRDHEEIDLYLEDLNSEATIDQAAKLLGVNHLQKVKLQGPLDFPVNGILFQKKKSVIRPMVALVCHFNEQNPMNVVFYTDSCCRKTFLSERTLMALLRKQSLPSELSINIHGTEVTSSVSPAQFSHVNVLGGDFFSASQTTLLLDYPNSKCKIIKGSPFEKI